MRFSIHSLSIWRKAPIFLKTIKFEHSVFALPFAYLTLFLAEGGIPSLKHLGLITLAMVSARTFAMGINRIVDAEIDARNPRTASRALPAGILSKGEALFFSLLALAIFVFTTFQLSPPCRYLWPIVIAPMVLYPYAKRFTWASHLILGFVYMIVPGGVWIAVSGQLPLAPVILGIGAGFWVAGFDILYSCQDLEIDRKQGIHSLVSDFGLKKGLFISRLFHLLTVLALSATGVLLGGGYLYHIGVGAFLLLLIYEHRLFSPYDISRLNQAFFNMNGIISIIFFVFVVADVLI